MNEPLLTQKDDVAMHVAQQPLQKVRHVHGSKVGRLEQTYNPMCWHFGDTVRVAGPS
jgi:hypothetical protein